MSRSTLRLFSLKIYSAMKAQSELLRSLQTRGIKDALL